MAAEQKFSDVKDGTTQPRGVIAGRAKSTNNKEALDHLRTLMLAERFAKEDVRADGQPVPPPPSKQETLDALIAKKLQEELDREFAVQDAKRGQFPVVWPVRQMPIQSDNVLAVKTSKRVEVPCKPNPVLDRINQELADMAREREKNRAHLKEE